MSFDELAEAIYHASHQNEKPSRDFIKLFRERHYCFFSHSGKISKSEEQEKELDPTSFERFINYYVDLPDNEKHESTLLDISAYIIDKNPPISDKAKTAFTQCLKNKQEDKPINQETGRQIDEERLKSHFKYTFKKTGGGFETLLSLLMDDRKPKDFAKIALQIHESKYFVKGGFKTFISWYRTFCEIVGCECIESYKPCKLKPTDKEALYWGFLTT